MKQKIKDEIDKEFKKFIIDNFSYSDIGMDEEGKYGENKISWMWIEGFEGKMSKKLREKIIKIIKKANKNYYK